MAGGMQSWKGGGKCSWERGHRENPCVKLIANMTAQQEDILSEGAVWKIIPHSSPHKWLVCACSYCAPKKTRISPLAPAWKDQTQRISPHPGSTHAPLSALGACQWGGHRPTPCWKGGWLGTPAARCTRRWCSKRDYMLKHSPWAKSGSPLSAEPWALSDHMEVRQHRKCESAVLRPEPMAPGEVGTSLPEVRASSGRNSEFVGETALPPRQRRKNGSKNNRIITDVNPLMLRR